MGGGVGICELVPPLFFSGSLTVGAAAADVV